MDYSQLKVLHIELEEPYMDDSGYQETLLAKYQRRICKDVCLVVSNLKMDSRGEISVLQPSSYLDQNGTKIVRLRCFNENQKRRSVYNSLYHTIKDFAPAIIMVHGMLLFDVWAAAKYKKRNNKGCVIVRDSHSTPDKFYPNGLTQWNRLTLFVTSLFNRQFSKYCKYLYGINNGTLGIMEKYLGADMNKLRLLPLGYDDDLIDYANQTQISKAVRKRYGLSDDSFVIVHGGKLDAGKKTDRLLACLNRLPLNSVIVIFGGFCSLDYETLCRKTVADFSDRVRFVGPLEQKDIYELYLGVDMAVFPGAPSVLRQQAVSTGLPVIIAVEDGDREINIVRGGNGIVLSDNWTEDELVESIEEIYSNYDGYKKKSEYLLETEYQQYAYSSLARKILDDCLTL